MNEGYSILGWSGRMSVAASKEAFVTWMNSVDQSPEGESYVPLCKTVPPRLRSKSTLLSRFIMEPFFELVNDTSIAPNSVDFVFASKYGEIGVLESLLTSIHTKEPLSPLDFCNSVHHTATGYLSIASKNKNISRTISAADRSFSSALMDAMCLLSLEKSHIVSLMMADEHVPPFLSVPSQLPFGIVVWIKKGKDDKSIAFFEKETLQKFVTQNIQPFEFLKEVLMIQK